MVRGVPSAAIMEGALGAPRPAGGRGSRPAGAVALARSEPRAVRRGDVPGGVAASSAPVRARAPRPARASRPRVPSLGARLLDARGRVPSRRTLASGIASTRRRAIPRRAAGCSLASALVRVASNRLARERPSHPSPLPTPAPCFPQSFAFLLLFGAERVASAARHPDAARFGFLLTPTHLAVWRRAFALTVVACSGRPSSRRAPRATVRPGSRRPDARRALRWSGFAPSSGSAATRLPSACRPRSLAAAARLFAHRRTAAKLAEAYGGFPRRGGRERGGGTRAYFQTRGRGGEGGTDRESASTIRADVAATLACALSLALRAVPPRASVRRLLRVLRARWPGDARRAAFADAPRRNEAARRRAEAEEEGRRVGELPGERSRPPPASFSAARTRWRARRTPRRTRPRVRVPAPGTRGGGRGQGGVARLYVYASDARGGRAAARGENENRRRAESRSSPARRSVLLPARPGGERGRAPEREEEDAKRRRTAARDDDASVDASDRATRLSAPLLDGYAASDDDVDGARLEARSGANSACDDPGTGAHGSDRSGASTPRGPPTFEAPPLATRLFARFAGALAAVVVVFASLAFPSVAAAPALRSRSARSRRAGHGGFARRRGRRSSRTSRRGPAEYAAASLPEAVLRKVVVGGGGGGGGCPRGIFFSATRRRLFGARALQVPGPPPGRVLEDAATAYGLLATLAAVAVATRAARRCPTEDGLEEALVAATGRGSPATARARAPAAFSFPSGAGGRRVPPGGDGDAEIVETFLSGDEEK